MESIGTWFVELLGSPLALKASVAVLSTGLVSGLVWRMVAGIRYKYAQDLVVRTFGEIRAAVLGVHQTYVTEIVRGRADGKLTDEEKARAKDAVVSELKSYLGVKGLKALARILGLSPALLDQWLGGKVEATVAELKAGGMLPKGPTAVPR